MTRSRAVELGSGRLLLGIAFIAFVGLGLPDGLLGTGWPAIRSEFGRPVGDLGLVISVGIGAYGIIATGSGRLTAKLGAGGALVVAYALVMAGALIVIIASSFVVLLVGTTALSAGNGLLDPVINTHVARAHGVRTMNLLHSSFGLGATIGPIVMVWALGRPGTWRSGYEPVLVFGIAMLALTAATRRRWGVPARVESRRRPPAVPFITAVPTLMGFALAGGIETATGQWAFSILVEDRGLARATAAAFVALFWGGLTLGRLSGALWGDRIGLVLILRSSVVTVVIGLGWLAFAPAMAPLGLPVAGAGMALIFPTLVVRAAGRFGSGADTIIGWGFGAMSVGVAVLPYALGRVADIWDLAAVAPVLVLIGLMLAIVVGTNLHRSDVPRRADRIT